MEAVMKREFARARESPTSSQPLNCLSCPGSHVTIHKIGGTVATDLWNERLDDVKAGSMRSALVRMRRSGMTL
jgi:hypothetical protein